jgi:hypothetical protein
MRELVTHGSESDMYLTNCRECTLRIFGDVVLRTIKYKWQEAAEGMGKLHNNKYHNLYPSPDVIRVIKSRVIGWTGDVGFIGELIIAYRIY